MCGHTCAHVGRGASEAAPQPNCKGPEAAGRREFSMRGGWAGRQAAASDYPWRELHRKSQIPFPAIPPLRVEFKGATAPCRGPRSQLFPAALQVQGNSRQRPPRNKNNPPEHAHVQSGCRLTGRMSRSQQSNLHCNPAATKARTAPGPPLTPGPLMGQTSHRGPILPGGLWAQLRSKQPSPH